MSGCEELNTNNGDSDGNDNTPSEYDRFVGTWIRNDWYYFTLFSDGTCSYAEWGIALGGYWELKDGKLVINLYTEGLTPTFNYYFSENYTQLHLKSSGQDEYAIYIKE